jgi:type IV secretion system protein VirD4
LWRARQARNVTTYGSARWAGLKDIARAGLHCDAGVFLGRVDGAYLRHDGPEHIMAFAPTRSGKGVGLVVPTLLGWTGSAVIHDIKGENWQLTAGWRQRFSHCLLFNPTDPHSAHYNPLLEVRRGEHEVRDVQNIADILVDPEGALERRNHWEKTSHALLVGAILHVLYAEEEKTLARVATFLSEPQRTFTATLRRMMTTNHLGTQQAPIVHPVVASAAREVLNKSENERSGVLSTAMSFLGLYRDPTVAHVTSRCDWRIADLIESKQPVSLYLVVPPSDISRIKPLIRLILNQIGRRLTEHLHAEGNVVRKGHDIRLVIPGTERAPKQTRNPDPALIALMAEAMDMRDAVLARPDQALSSIAASLGQCRKRLTRLLHISWIAPDIIRAIVEGSQPEDLTAKTLMAIDLPLRWDQQKVALGFN